MVFSVSLSIMYLLRLMLSSPNVADELTESPESIAWEDSFSSDEYLCIM